MPGLKLQLVSKVNHDRLEGVLGGDLQLDLNRYLDVLVVGSDNFFVDLYNSNVSWFEEPGSS